MNASKSARKTGLPDKPTFTVTPIGNSFVISAAWPDGFTEILVGLYTDPRAARDWIKLRAHDYVAETLARQADAGRARPSA